MAWKALGSLAGIFAVRTEGQALGSILELPARTRSTIVLIRATACVAGEVAVLALEAVVVLVTEATVPKNQCSVCCAGQTDSGRRTREARCGALLAGHSIAEFTGKALAGAVPHREGRVANRAIRKGGANLAVGRTRGAFSSVFVGLDGTGTDP